MPPERVEGDVGEFPDRVGDQHRRDTNVGEHVERVCCPGRHGSPLCEEFGDMVDHPAAVPGHVPIPRGYFGGIVHLVIASGSELPSVDSRNAGVSKIL